MGVAAAFQEGRGRGEGCGRHTPWAASPGRRCPGSRLPAAFPRGFTSTLRTRNGGGVPACRVSAPFPAQHPLSLPPPGTFETEMKVVQPRCPRGRASPGRRTRSPHPAEPPFSNGKLLVGVLRVPAVGPLALALGSRRQPPRAAGHAPRPHSARGWLAPRQPGRRESPSRGAGRTMELGAGPAGRRAGAAASGAGQRGLGSSPLGRRSHPAPIATCRLFLPLKPPLLELALPHHWPSTAAAGARSSGRVGGCVGGSGRARLYQPGSAVFLW